MQVRHVFATAGRIGLGCLVVLACAALATFGTYLGLGLSAGSLPSPLPPAEAFLPTTSLLSPRSATPAEVVAARFPSAEDAPLPVTFSTSSVIPGQRGEPFDLNIVSGMATTRPLWPAVEETAPSMGATGGTDPAQPSGSARPEPPKGQAADVSLRRLAARAPNVLNDAMIASIRQRLKLTAEQQKLWPAVEAALRKIVYTRAAMNPQSRGQAVTTTAYIDPASDEVRELKSAALPLIMRLNDEQKREVKLLAYVMGLEAVVSQF